ncbi:MAG TPA: CopG family transcriptional regulator [Gemmatimonadales bacterium]
MRTTLNLDDDVMRAIRTLARERGESLGSVVSTLVRDALRAPDEVTYASDFPVFRVREGAPPITPEMVGEALEDS